MDNNHFEARMRQGERFHGLRLERDAWPIIRVDGHGFSRLTQKHFEKPFDSRFHDIMVETARVLVEEFGGIYGYTESDEISVLLPRDWSMFDRSLEKAVSISAGIASATFTQGCGFPVRFDSRVWLGGEYSQVIDYFRWRQADATRCALNGWCYWTLRQQGRSYAAATSTLEGLSQTDKEALLTQHDVPFETAPAWQKYGVGLYWQQFQKEGYDPIRQQKVVALRRRLVVNSDLPLKHEYSQWLQSLLKRHHADNGLDETAGAG
jgi:tRNA(His) 5'-end guanylyltransferase